MLRAGSHITTNRAVFSHTANRNLPAGTPGHIIGIRDLGQGAGPEVLVKLRGSTWPLSLEQAAVSEVEDLPIY